MKKIDQLSLKTILLTSLMLPVVFGTASPQATISVKDRIAALNKQPANQAVATAALTDKNNLTGKRNANAVLGTSVKKAEDRVIQVFEQLFIAAAKNPEYALRLKINLKRIEKTFPNVAVAPGRAALKTGDDYLDKAILVASTYAPYNNSLKITQVDVDAYPGLTDDWKKIAAGALLPQNNGKDIAYDPFSLGMVLVYRLRNAEKLGGQDPMAIDLYDKNAAFVFEKEAKMASEASGTGTGLVKPKVSPLVANGPHVDPKELASAIKKHQDNPVVTYPIIPLQ